MLNALAFAMKNKGVQQMRVVQMNVPLMSGFDSTLKSNSHGNEWESQTYTLLCFSVHHMKLCLWCLVLSKQQHEKLKDNDFHNRAKTNRNISNTIIPYILCTKNITHISGQDQK